MNTYPESRLPLRPEHVIWVPEHLDELGLPKIVAMWCTHRLPQPDDGNGIDFYRVIGITKWGQAICYDWPISRHYPSGARTFLEGLFSSADSRS